MIESEFASVDALIDKQDSSRLRIDIRLHAPTLPEVRQDCPHVSLRQAIREGSREALEEAERKRPKPVERRSSGSWLGRIFVFTICAAIGSGATLVASSVGRHPDPKYAAGSPAPPLVHEPLLAPPPADAADPGSQSAAVIPDPHDGQAANGPAPSGPGTFGLHDQ